MKFLFKLIVIKFFSPIYNFVTTSLSCFSVVFLFFFGVTVFFMMAAGITKNFQSEESRIKDSLITCSQIAPKTFREKDYDEKSRQRDWERWAKDPPKKQKPRNGKLKEEAIVFWKDSDAQTILDAIDNQDVKTLMQLKEEGKLIFTQKEYKITYIKSLISADIMVITFKNGQYDHMEGYAFRKKIW